MTDIQSLSNELLLRIFEELKRVTLPRIRNNLVYCMLCCRHWHDLVVGILYAQVQLDYRAYGPCGPHGPKALPSDFRFIKQATNFDRVKSLTLKLPSSRLSSNSNAKHPDNLLSVDDIVRFLSSLSKLETFSLDIHNRIDNDDEETMSNSNTPLSSISRILLALSSTVVHLRLKFSDISTEVHPHKLNHHFGPHQVCEALRTLLPRLHTLELAGLEENQICADFLAPHQADVTSAKGSEHKQGNSRPIHQPSLSMCSLRHITVQANLDCEEAHDFARKLSHYHDTKRFPYLQSFNIITHEEARPDDSRQRGLIWDTYYVYDILAQTTILIPHSSCFIVRDDVDDDEYQTLHTDNDEFFMARDIDGDEYFFDEKHELISAIFGPAKWTFDHKWGYMPPVVRSSGEQRTSDSVGDSDSEDDPVSLRLQDAMDRETMEERYDISPPIWEWESTTECPLIKARCKSGFSTTEDEALTRGIKIELPAGWEMRRVWDLEPYTEDDHEEEDLIPVFNGV